MESITIEKPKIGKYPAYKDFTEPWIGTIPIHWKIKKLKHIFSEKRHTNNPKLNCGSISFGKVIVKDDEKIPASTKASYQEVLKGEFLINPLNLNFDLISLRIALSDINVVVSPGYIVLKNIIDINKEYFKYLLHRYDVEYMKLLGSGIRQTISFTHIANSFLPFPPIDEQTAIANFLDRKTTLIDKAIAQKEKQIELLKERRQILTNHILLEGLDGKVKLKPSGIEGVKSVPQHWEIKKLKYLLTERNERSISGEEPLFMVSQVHGLVIRSEYHEKAEVAQTTVGSKRVFQNDLVFNKLKAHLGVFFKSNIDQVGLVSPDYAVYHAIGGIEDLKYLELLFRHPAYIKQFICNATGIVEGLIRLYTGDLFNIKVPVPPVDEQSSILSAVDRLNMKIVRGIQLKQMEIEKLKEYRQTLINSTVTGKIRVSLEN